MKRTGTILLLSFFAVLAAAGCRKKSRRAPATGTDRGSEPTASVAQENTVKKVDEPVTDAVIPSTMTALSDLGTPLFAVHLDLQKILETSVFLETGISARISEAFTKDSDRMDRETLGTCLGFELKHPGQLITRLFLFIQENRDKPFILLDLPQDAGKWMTCMKNASKGTAKPADVTIGGAQGTKITGKDGRNSFFVPVGKQKVLSFRDERPAFLETFKAGEGHLGKGDVENYFPEGPWCARAVVRGFELKNLPDLAEMLPTLKTVDVDAVLGLTNGLTFRARVDTKDLRMAETLAGMANFMKGNPQMKQQLKSVGMDENLPDKLRIRAEGPLVHVHLDLDIATLKLLAEKVNNMMPPAATTAPAIAAPAPDVPTAPDAPPPVETPSAD